MPARNVYQLYSLFMTPRQLPIDLGVEVAPVGSTKTPESADTKSTTSLKQQKLRLEDY
jgi:hypothetical protein